MLRCVLDTATVLQNRVGQYGPIKLPKNEPGIDLDMGHLVTRSFRNLGKMQIGAQNGNKYS